MKNCININHPDVTILASELNLPKIVVAAKIGVWQEEHNILDRFPTTEELFTNSIINKNIVKPGVKELFESNSELAQIGTPEQYSQYLDTIFPDSKVKDIVYHGTLPQNKFEKFDKQKGTNLSGEYGGIHFGDLTAAIERPTKIVKAENFLAGIEEDLSNFKPNIIPVILNIENIKRVEEGKNWGQGDWSKLISKENEADGYVYTNKIENKGKDSYVVFEPEQIHILGSKQDIEGFKKFVQGKNIESTTDSQTSITLPQKEISHYSIRKLILENIKSDYQDLSKDSNKPDYQRITDNTISNFEKLSKREQETLTKNITHLSNKLSAITGISFQIINDPEQRFKGTLNNGKAIINLAYVTNDTPIHEILGHPIIRYIKTNNSELYNNLVNEINNSEQGTQVLNSTKSKYNDKSEDDIMEESIVELLSLMISNDINEQETGLLKLLKDIYAFFKNIVNTIFDNEVQINDNMNFEELSNFLSNKIKGYENEADTYIRDIVRQMFNLELGNEIFEQRQETVIPSPIENAFEYFKKEFGETNAKEFRNINGAYDNPQMFTDFLNDLIPEKKHVKYILENNVSVIQNLFNRVLIKNEIQEDVVETRTPEEIAKSIGYEFYRINDVFELLQYKKLYNAGSVICTYNNPQNRLESSFIFILKRSYADLVVPVFKLTQEYLKQNHEGAKLWREFLIKDNRLKEDGSFDLRNLSIKREDPYGTSIMNIQILRQGGSQKVLNRYNHASALNYPALTSPDYTYSGDLNNLVIGLQDAIRNIEGVPKSKNKSVTPSFNGKVVERQGKLYAFDFEEDGIYYNKYGFLNNIGYHRINTNEEMIFGKYFINFKLKKAIIFNDMIIDSDIDEIRNAMKNMSSNGTFRIGNITSNEIYLVTSHKNKITLHNPDTNNNESIIFTIEKGNIKMLETNYKTIYKGSFKHMYSLEKVVFSNALKIQDDVLEYNKNVKILEAPFVTEINSGFLYSNTEMEYLYLPNLRKVGPNFLFANEKLKTLDLPNLEFVEHNFLMSNIDLTILRLPKVKTIDDSFLYNNTKLKILDLPNLEIFGLDFLKRNTDLELLFLPKIKDLNNTKLLQNNESLRSLYAPNTEEIGHITFPKKTKLKSLYFPKLKFQETVAQSYQFITSISENKQIKHLYISQDNNIAKIQGSNLLRNLRNSLLESSELDILENIDEHKEIAKRESEGLHELYMSFENPKEFLAIYEQYFGVHPNRTISDFIDYAIDLKLKENSIQSKYQKAEQSILTPQQIQNIQEVNKPIYIGGFSTEGRGTLEGDGKDKQMRKDSVGFIGELNPNKSDRFESSTYGSFLHFNSNPVIVQEDRLIYSLPDNINKGNKIMLALNGSVPDTDLLDKTKQLLLDLHNKGFEFIVGDMPSDHANNRLGDDDFVRYLQSIGANYTVYGNGKESRIPLTFNIEEFEKASDLIINNENEIAITTEFTIEEVAEKMKQRFGIDYELLDDVEFEQRLNDANVRYESKVVPPLATITDEELEKSLQKSIENEIADYERLIVNGEEITPETMKKDKNVYNLYQDIVRYDQFIAEHFTSTETKNLFNPSVATLIKHFVVKYNVDISPLLTPKPFDIKEYIKIIHSLNKEISEITSTLKYKTNPNDNPELYKQYPFTIKTLFELKIAAVGTIWLQLNSKTDEYKLNDLKFVVDDTERLTHSFSLKLYNNRDSVGYIESTTQIESTGVNHEYVKTSERLGQRLYRGFSWGLKSVSDEHVISYKNFVPITVNNNEDIHAYNAWERWVEKGIAIDKGQYYQILKQKDNVSTKGFYDPHLRKAILKRNGANLSTPIHEAFSHPFIELVKIENPDLYENLLNRARYISEIKSHVDNIYSDVSQDVRDKEYIAHAIDMYYKMELNNHEYYGLIDAIRQFLTYISNALKSILNIDNLEIKDIPLDITLQDLSRYIIYGKGTINLNRNPIVSADNGQPSKLHKTLTKLIGVIPGINNNEDVMEIYNKTKTPEFKEWFKDSVLIDDNNEPLLFFHSGASNINSFDKPSKRFNYTFFHQLILPINNSNSTRQIYPVFLKSVNPYELNDFGAFITTVSVKLPFKNNDSYYDQVIKENNHDSVINYPSYQKEFSEDLYNDNIPLVITEDYRSNDDESPFDTWQRLMEAGEIAIPKSKSYNIKSIFNSGAWESKDENIYADKVENSLQSNTSKPYLKNSEFKKRYSGNVIDILNNIIKSGHILSPLIQELLKAPDARKILNSLSTIVITPGSSIYNKYAKDANDIREQKGLSPINLNGLYIHDSKTIAMVNNIIDPNFSDTTFIHEVIHALTKEKIDTEYYEEWTAIYDYVWGKLKDNGINPKDYYAMSNPHELMTGIFTKSDFMKLLASIPGENNTSLFQDIINFFKRILKINNISLLEEVMNEAMNLINNKPVSRKYIDYINSEIGQAVVNNDPIMNYIHGDKADYIDLIESQDNIPEEQPFVRYKYSPLEVKSYINENELINKRVYKQSELNSLLKKVNTINSKQGYTRYKIIKRNDDNYVIIDNIDNEKVETIKKDLLKDKYKKDDYGLNVPWYYYADEIKDRNVIFKHKDIYFSLGKDAFLYMIQNNIDPEYTNQVKNKFSKDLDLSNTEYNTLSDIVYKNNNIYLKIINNEPAYIPDYKGILIKKDVPLLFYKGKNLNINKVGTPVLINTKDITIDNNGVVTSDNLPIIELDYDKTITNERKLSNPDYYINTIYNDLKLSAYLTIEEADNISNNIQLKLKRDNQLYDINFRKNGDYVKINMQMNEDNKINVLKNFNPELVGKLVDMNIDVYNMDQNYLQALYNLTTNDLNNDLTCSI